MDKTTPYLLTMCSYTPNLPRFFESVKKIDVEQIVVAFEPYPRGLKECHYTGQTYPGHIKKYSFLPEIIDKLDPERYIIFTDTEDVIFQAPLPEFTKDLHLAPENVPTHRNTWWEQHIVSYVDHRFDELLDKPIYCSGTWATKVKTFSAYLKFFEELGRTYEVAGFGDQLYFNLFLLKHPELTRDESVNTFCSLHANIHRKDIYKENGIWKHEGEIISCVHANGSLKEYL